MSNGESGPQALELVAQGATLMRVENEILMSAAVQRPRDEGAIVKGALRELDLVPEEASRAYYSIPYKERQADGSVKIVKVEGPSIKAAMALARRWGNCTVSCRVLNEDEGGFDLEGVFVDMETNFRLARPQRVGKTFKRRGGQLDTLSPERQAMAIQSGASKAIRGAILGSLPAYLVGAYDRKARSIAGGNLERPADAKAVEAVKSAFGKLEVTLEQLEGYAGDPPSAWTGTHIADLRGLWNAIQDGQTTVAEVFGPEKPTIEGPKSKAEAAAEVNQTPLPSADPDADLAAEAKAREEAEASAQSGPPPLAVDRPKVWTMVLARAKATKTGTSAVLLALTGKHNMPDLSDARSWNWRRSCNHRLPLARG
jgi:hypothetical protein